MGLKKSSLILYALPEYAVYLASIPVVLYLPYVYSRDMGLSLGDVGMILFVARLSDVITDPLIGYFSDKTNTRIGRRKPWLIIGTVLLMFSAYMLFNPPATVSNSYLLIWAVLLWLVLRTRKIQCSVIDFKKIISEPSSRTKREGEITYLNRSTKTSFIQTLLFLSPRKIS